MFGYKLMFWFCRHPDQQTSNGVSLEAGQGYYIEGLMSESTGRDHLSIGVQFPDGKMLRPIPKKYLSKARIGKSLKISYKKKAKLIVSFALCSLA